MTQIRIEAVSGATPINVYVADVYGNNQSLIGTITNTGVIPPAARFYPPSLFNTAPAIMVKLIDANGCEKNRSFVIEKFLFLSEFDMNVRDLIYPNPTYGDVYIDNDESVILTIDDFDGKSIMTLSLNELNNKLDLSHLAKGIYIFRLKGKNSTVVRKISII